MSEQKSNRRSSGGRPIMVLLELLGRRWVLRILWELRDDPLSFRGLQAACDGVSPSVLNQRLSDLRGVDLVALGNDGYHLTASGRSLFQYFQPLNRWAEDWAGQLEDGQ